MYVDLDSDNDVLYIRRDHAKICGSKEFVQDDFIVLSYDASDEIVGMIMLDAHSFVETWYKHPIRPMLPRDILVSIDLWVFRQYE